MVNHIIKICGIRDPVTAEKAANAGAHFIGIVFHPSSTRYVFIRQQRYPMQKKLVHYLLLYLLIILPLKYNHL